LSSDPQVLKNWAKEFTQNLYFLTDFINGLKLDGWYILKYEDLVDKSWKDLEEYLGVSLELEHDMRKSFKHVSRTNQYGNWRHWFTLEDVIFFKPIFNNFLQSHGYDSVDWDLEKITSLPSVEGSGYMKRLFYHKNGPNSYSKNILGELKRFIWGNSIRVE
jgi:histidinol phosphatase-like enzyme